MKYTVNTANLEDIAFERQNDGSIDLVLNRGDYGINMSASEFKELRKAVGYVWQEVESGG